MFWTITGSNLLIQNAGVENWASRENKIGPVPDSLGFGSLDPHIPGATLARRSSDLQIKLLNTQFIRFDRN